MPEYLLSVFYGKEEARTKNVRANSFMHEFLKEYGPFIIAAIAILFLVALISSDAVQGIVRNGFTTILQNLFNRTGLTGAGG